MPGTFMAPTESYESSLPGIIKGFEEITVCCTKCQ